MAAVRDFEHQPSDRLLPVGNGHANSGRAGSRLSVLLAVLVLLMTACVSAADESAEDIARDSSDSSSSTTIDTDEQDNSGSVAQDAVTEVPIVDEFELYPKTLPPDPGGEWEPLRALNPLVNNGSIVVGEGDTWRTFDRQLVESSSAPFSPGDGQGHVLAGSWPDVAIWIGGAGTHIVNITTGENIVTSDLYPNAVAPRLPAKRRGAWTWFPSEEPVVIDFAELNLHPIPERTANTQNPPMSPDGELILVDGREDEQSSWRIDVRPTSDPSAVAWSYEVPPEIRLLDRGHFDDHGRIVLRALHDDGTSVVEYRGSAGESLELIGPEQIWTDLYPGVPIHPDGAQAFVLTQDGVETPIGLRDDATLVCEATGWDAAVRRGEVLFFDAEFQGVSTVPLDTSRHVEPYKFGTGIWLLGASTEFGRAVLGFVDCERREVLDPTEIGELFGLGTVWDFQPDEHDRASNGYELATLTSDTGDGVILSDDDGVLWPVLRTEVVHDISLAPDGTSFVASYLWGTEQTVGVISLSLTEHTQPTTIVVDGPRSVAWLLAETAAA